MKILLIVNSFIKDVFHIKFNQHVRFSKRAEQSLNEMKKGKPVLCEDISGNKYFMT